jgi:hypothetical protein
VKRRVESDPTIPPAELVDYRAWCAGRGLPPYGDPGDRESMKAAVGQWEVWERLRAEWAAAHGMAEVDLPTSGCGTPFDIDLI